MIEVKDLTKTFDGFTALDKTCVTVPDGGVYGLVGPNGAGKSTLIRHLTGIYRPDSGQVLVDGEPVYENPEKKKDYYRCSFSEGEEKEVLLVYIVPDNLLEQDNLLYSINLYGEGSSDELKAFKIR